MTNRTPKALPSQTELHRLFQYNPITGCLIWQDRPDSDFKTKHHAKLWRLLRVNKVAGSPIKNGYIQIGFCGDTYLAHRLIWAFHHGDIGVKLLIDHIDGNTSNNLIENLRLVSRSVNQRNQKPSATNTSGFRGVIWDKNMRKWRARPKVNGKVHCLGSFTSIQEAADVTATFYRENGFSERHIGQ